MKKVVALSSTLFALPLLVAAQTGGTLGPIQTFIISLGNLVSLLIPIAIGIAMVVFFWGLIKYIQKPEISEGKNIMIAGILALFIMVSIWGIINVVQVAVLGGSGSPNSIRAPHFPTNAN